ncbi:MAG: hypothetical protein M0014_02700 [Actinomycetota bacterium]|jgi:hypothetical protein|nr:hypothetical protein [Actinomycetota bacterium]
MTNDAGQLAFLETASGEDGKARVQALARPGDPRPPRLLPSERFVGDGPLTDGGELLDGVREQYRKRSDATRGSFRESEIAFKRALGAALALDIVPMIWSVPGTGKSSMIEAVGRELGVPVKVILLNQIDAIDLGGTPVGVEATSEDVDLDAPNNIFQRVPGARDRQVAVPHVAPSWALDLVNANCGILLVDELTTARPETQGNILNIITSRRIGDLQIPSSVRLVFAGNPPGVGTYGLTPALSSRLCHLDMPTNDVNAFALGLLGEHAPVPIPEIPEGLLHPQSTARFEAAATIAGFLQVNSDKMSTPPSASEEDPRGWGNKRTWGETMFMRVEAARVAGVIEDDVAFVLAAGILGEGLASEYEQFARKRDLPRIEDILEQPRLVKRYPRADQVLSILASISTMLKAAAGDLSQPPEQRQQLWLKAAYVVAQVAVTEDIDVTTDDLARLVSERGLTILSPHADPAAMALIPLRNTKPADLSMPPGLATFLSDGLAAPVLQQPVFSERGR